MAARARRIELLAGYWFLTVVVALGGVLLAFAVLLVDSVVGRAGVFAAMAISPDAARTILGSIAGSLITIASLTASLTIVTLQLLSNQYTPRTVRGFLRRKVSQVVSGAFVGIFLYCLVLLLFVREPGDENLPFVPSLGVVSSVVLAAFGLVLLVLFINALARMIQVSTMVSEIADATIAVIRRRADAGETALPDSERPRLLIPSGDRVGYVRSTSAAAAVAGAASSEAGTLVLLVRPGDFVTTVTPIAAWYPAAGTAARPPAALVEAARRAIAIGTERDLDDDPAFGLRQVADIAMRALSPGINDPSTAVTSVGYLRSVFEELAARPLNPSVARAGGLIVIASERSFDELVDVLAEVILYINEDLRIAEAVADAALSAAAVAARHGYGDRASRLRSEAASVIDAVRPAGRTARDEVRLRALEQRLQVV